MASRIASGRSSATFKRLKAGPEGLRLPCSQSCKVRGLTPSMAAKAD